MSRTRIALALHTIPFFSATAWSLYAGYAFWSEAIGDPAVTIILMLMIDITAIIGYLVHLFGYDVALARIRHALPLVNSFGAMHWVHDRASRSFLGDGGAWVVAILVVAANATVMYVVMSSFDRLWFGIDEYERMQRMKRIDALREGLTAMNAEVGAFIATISDVQNVTSQVRIALPEPVRCMRCGAELVVQPGKNPEMARRASARFGCPKCVVDPAGVNSSSRESV
jgi:uncharacterized membrane protein YecN with MAPEG domain